MITELTTDYYVRPLDENDLDGPYPAWFNDLGVCRYNSHAKFFKTRAFFANYVNQLNTEDRVVWAICHSTDGHIGNVSLQDICLINRTAEFAILIGDQRHWGKGIGLAAGKKIVHHAFFRLNIERIYCGTASINEGMKRLARAMGMTLEGTRRQHFYLEGSRVDLLEYGMLRNEISLDAEGYVSLKGSA
ncbi:MAG: GNAT family N-acetyltransferase [Anaerolineaceae bacterium]|nr:GNAT family N-acetyltransferase [Betaproteobacteria bacterium]